MPINSLQGLSLDYPLAEHTSWRVGGHAQRFYQPNTIDALSHFIAHLPHDEYIIWLGLGSNVLIRDGGIQGTVIYPCRGIKQLIRLPNGHVRAEAGVTCAKLAKFCAKHQLKGGEFFAGIPGTVGGALAMNAGAFGGETWRHIALVETLNRQGKQQQRKKNEYNISYRSVRAPVAEEWFIAGHFYFPEANDSIETGREHIRKLLRKRGHYQPIGTFNAGSVFKNPPGFASAQLIESSGLKGLRIGGAYVSPKHANFIINDGTATAADIENLISKIQCIVAEQHHVQLHTEVRILGTPAAVPQ